MSTTLILLHGANGSAATLQPLSSLLTDDLDLLIPDWPGHGGRALQPQLDVPMIAIDVLRQMDARGSEQAVVFGYSLGGVVALYLARHFPDRILGVATLATKIVFDPGAVRHLLYLSELDRLARIPGRVAALAERHQPNDWQAVMEMNRRMFVALGSTAPLTGYDLPAIGKPALVMSGTEDQLVGAQETREMARLLAATLLLFPGPAHPLEQVPLARVAQQLRDWLATIPSMP